ncbi:MAG: PDZ domain-containing protein [Chloroflexi bacterium AL-W]|nr:PDZ domain-containing protein [Chloroflexi bacterium AL-N1]NOK65413.1 PDZ domain-containing protein [Chloroflexi bacterium AL-N10]NOK72321.1 PDZ domain-containing protein [Chloroflexi bacterium AL-N5]NOK79592.1 PDZ domain-containing protein [Chloroflexi bacterium AL-W]NOK87508.1 PDZ domain-containing protein [Chloroflexi bacterium AL-N15]
MRFFNRSFPFAFGILLLLTSCSVNDILEITRESNDTQTERVASEPQNTKPDEPVSQATHTPAVPINDVDPVPTLLPETTEALVAEQQVMVQLFRRANPAVVSIEVIGVHPPVEGLPMQDFAFGHGSGFLYDNQGHVVTNHHVIENGTDYQVRFASGEIIAAQLVGSDAGSDLAVLKVEDLPADVAPLSIADSGNVEVGQMAVAIGNPFQLRNTLTVGVISGVGRALRGPQSAQGGWFSIPNIIQTDAAINPGNSGGPLLNIHGEVIGVNTAISSGSGTFEGVGYAVPSNTVTRVVPALIRNGLYEHPWMGIGMYTIEPRYAQQHDLTIQQGVLVTAVQDDSPAARSGLLPAETDSDVNLNPRNGDIIIAVDDQTIRSSDDLIRYLELETSVGDTITFTLIRDGEEQQIDLLLAGRPRQ